MKRLYLATILDRYELPIAVADTPEELANHLGVTRYTVLSVISHAKKHKRSCMYHKIEYNEREWNE